MADWTEDDTDLFRSVGGTRINPGKGLDAEWMFGWFPQDPFTDATLDLGAKLFSDVAPLLEGSGAGKTVLLYEAVRQVWQRDLDSGPQAIGDCVSWGFGGAVDLLACVEIVAGEAESYDWPRRASTEVIYALSRREYGNASRFRDGSSSVWAAVAVVKGGTLSREAIRQYDPARPEYDGDRARRWGKTGLPDDLEPLAREHRIANAALVTRFEDARDAIANGYPVAVGSNQGFVTVRDADGFCAPSKSWSHCMKFIASRDDRRPGLLCMNSWGDTSPAGPTGEHAIPAGAFWVDAAICNAMLKQHGGFALSGFAGYQPRAEKLHALLGA